LGAEAIDTLRRAEAQACRAVGNRALALYQLAVPSSDERCTIDQERLHLTMALLEERIERAKRLQLEITDRVVQSDLWNMTTIWQSTALDRLTLCYTALGDVKKAVEYDRKSTSVSIHQLDPTVRGLSRFYYGLALYHAGDFQGANNPWWHTRENDRCTSAIALCKEPSAENTERLRF
jgi:tetratricopeptide (TPR) repeat protein